MSTDRHTRLCGALIIVAALMFPADGIGASAAGDRVAVVGRTAIAESDISCKIQIEKAYGNEKATREAALISLVNDAIEHETAAIHSVTITREEIDSFKRHVDEHTKAPEILQRVKAIFADDSASYERIYLVPKMMNRKLRDFYARSPEIHAHERGLIEKAYGLVVSGKSFQAAAEECGMKSSSFDIGGKGTAPHSDLPRIVGEESITANDRLIAILEKLAPGEICGKILEDDHTYEVIRLVKREGEIYSVEAVTVNKRPFDGWLRQETPNIRIDVAEQALRETIKIGYPDLWWVKNLR